MGSSSHSGICQMQNICCLLFSPGREMIVLVTRQSCATAKKRTGTECMSCTFQFEGLELEDWLWSWTPLDKGPKCEQNSIVSLVLIICSASGLGSPSCICSVQALPDDVGGSQSLIWHSGYVNVIWVPCTFAWGLPDGGTFQKR